MGSCPAAAAALKVWQRRPSSSLKSAAKGWISAEAARALNAKAKDFQDGTLSTKTLKWFPAHMGELNRQKPEIPDNLNERAHRVARRLNHRDTFRATDTNGVFRGDPVTGEQSYMTTAIQDNKDLMEPNVLVDFRACNSSTSA
ncbi:hypothetical protein HPB50_019980 [Hyalomma asiaticum]|uniref:Uncharacterized protein n=1 Tax=Hyalomma asiaticum TaxID=266040 RepID=A0ACB7TD69_HYAAI|nr:hypothetical protein HPB50_019980 [Hyalomma asiaticum]